MTCLGEKALLRLATAGDTRHTGHLTGDSVQLLPSTLRYVQEHLGWGTSLYHGKSSLPRQQNKLIAENSRKLRQKRIVIGRTQRL